MRPSTFFNAMGVLAISAGDSCAAALPRMPNPQQSTKLEIISSATRSLITWPPSFNALSHGNHENQTKDRRFQAAYPASLADSPPGAGSRVKTIDSASQSHR